MIDLKGSIVLLLGSTGMTGKFCKELLLKREAVVFSPPKIDCDLSNPLEIDSLFSEPPDYVINLAGYNGSIKTNRERPATIFSLTTRINQNVMDCSQMYGVKKVVTPLTSCGYPPYVIPLSEPYYLVDSPHESIQPHGYARRFIYLYGKYLNKQFGNKFIFPVFNNLFGPHDRFNEPDRIKFAGSIIKKIVDAGLEGKKSIELWGDGSPRRELLYAEDAAEALIRCLEYYEDYEECVNIGPQLDFTIKEFAERVKSILSWDGEIIWNNNMPNGQMVKILDNSKMKNALNWYPPTTLDQGITNTIIYYSNLTKTCPF